MPHQVARWRHLARKDKDLLLCGKDLVREPCYEVHTEIVPGGETMKVIQATRISLTCRDAKDSVSDYIRNIEILYTTVLGYTVWTIFYADIYSSIGGKVMWVRSRCGVNKAYRWDDGSLICVYCGVDTYPPGSGGWITPGGGFIVDCDAGLEFVKTEGETIKTYTAVDDDDNY